MLVDDAAQRLRRLSLVAGGVLVALVAGGAALRSTLPPRPLEVRSTGVSGTALQGEGFVRLNVTLEASGARELDDAVLTVAGVTQRGQHPPAFDDDDGRATVQLDLTPACASVPDDLADGVLELQLRDESGAAQRVQIAIPADSSLVRLLRYRCR